MRELTGFWISVLLLACVVAMGCERGYETPHEFELSDGTRCVSVEGESASCDWDAMRVKPIHITLSPGDYDGAKLNELLDEISDPSGATTGIEMTCDCEAKR